MKARRPSTRATEVAQRVLAECGVTHLHDIDPEAMAVRYRTGTVYVDGLDAAAALARAGDRGIIQVEAWSRGEPRARFSLAHELGHKLMHPAVDHYAQCVVDGPRQGRDFNVEREANDFAAELLMPMAFAAPRCAVAQPTVHDVERMAREFRTSAEATALRFVQLAPTPCAVVSVVGNVVRWGTTSRSYSGKIGRGALDPRSVVARVGARPRLAARAHEVAGDVWGSKRGVVEQVLTWGAGSALTWVVEV